MSDNCSYKTLSNLGPFNEGEVSGYGGHTPGELRVRDQQGRGDVEQPAMCGQQCSPRQAD